MDIVASVVVATFNRAGGLGPLVEGLEGQRDVGPFEVIIVDDGSSDGTWAELERLAATSALTLRPIRQERNAGPATARNAGWRAAGAPVVCFTDDDCVPQPAWLASLLAGAAGADIVQGQTLPNPQHEFRRGPFSRTMLVYNEEGYYETCNIAYRRELLARLQGFDETFRIAYGEDTDLAWRGIESGARTTFAPDALVYHDITPSDYGAFLREMRRRPVLLRTFKEHPGVRRRLEKGVFFRPTHPRVLALLVALVVLLFRIGSPVRWLLVLALGLNYAWWVRLSRPKPARKAGWAAVVPLALIADVYEIAILVRASLRYRTLLL